MYRQPNFAGLLAATASLGLAFSFFAPFISTWGTEEVGMSPSAFSVFMTCTSLCAILMGTVMGRLSDVKLARRHVLIVAAAGGALGYLGYAFLRDPHMLALVGCTILALSSGCFAQLFAHVREEYSDTKDPDLTPGLLMSIVRVCFSFSWTVGPAVGAVILVAFGFEGLFSAAALLWALFLAGVILHVPLRRRPRAEHGPARASVWKTFRRPDIAVSFIAFSVLAASQSINMMNLPLAIIRELGGTERDFGIVFGIGPIVEIPMMIWFGQLSSRGHQMRLIRLGFLVAIVYYAGLSLATEPWHVYILQILSGTMVSIVSNVAIMFFQDQLPSQPGLATALFANSQSAGNLAGVLSFGFVVEWVGHRGVFVSCIVLAVAAYFMILLYRRRDDLRAMP